MFISRFRGGVPGRSSPAERPGIEAIVLSAALPDQAHVPGMVHDHIVS